LLALSLIDQPLFLQERSAIPRVEGFAIALMVKIVHADYGFPIYGNAEHRGEATRRYRPCASSPTSFP
jgi:hypothetical protein